MLIEILYFDGCPSWKQALENVRTAAPDAEIEPINIANEALAMRERFAGSPTLRVKGEDLFPIGTTEYTLSCRLYSTPMGLRGWPTVEMIESALKELSESKKGEF